MHGDVMNGDANDNNWHFPPDSETDIAEGQG
jgi:hypothetical protein